MHRGHTHTHIYIYIYIHVTFYIHTSSIKRKNTKLQFINNMWNGYRMHMSAHNTTILQITEVTYHTLNCYIYIYIYIYIHKGKSKSNVFFFSTGIIADTVFRTCIIHQNEAGSLWITSLLLNMVTISLNSNVPSSNVSMYLCLIKFC